MGNNTTLRFGEDTRMPTKTFHVNCDGKMINFIQKFFFSRDVLAKLKVKSWPIDENH